MKKLLFILMILPTLALSQGCTTSLDMYELKDGDTVCKYRVLLSKCELYGGVIKHKINVISKDDSCKFFPTPHKGNRIKTIDLDPLLNDLEEA